MSKLISLALVTMVSIFLFCPVFAQESYSKNNLTFSVGLFQQVRYKFYISNGTYEVQQDELWNASPFRRIIEGLEVRNTGPLILGYLRRVSKKIAVGVNVNGGHYKRIYYKDVYQSLAHMGIAIDGRYYYYAKKKWEFYGAVSMGVRYQNLYSDVPNELGYFHIKSFSPIYQVSPLCVTYGKKTKALAELGIGYKGYASLGIQIGL
ncbi:hypothetical protein [Taibaiella soli]|uniref:Outer membrane protein beta-barrel domain-containing protein n=1 Tax=Taibaiella soli TaxID=1649169 RepID=A0A2W2C403_9BACT|nr:hypothetical protein [Taibaiella soli]PZF74853.1 hypothetical protein DN068_01255 [Taibaiella soli]